MWNMQVDHEGIFWFKKFLAPQYALIELQAYPGALKLNYLDSTTLHVTDGVILKSGQERRVKSFQLFEDYRA